jgi:hypothetical protein
MNLRLGFSYLPFLDDMEILGNDYDHKILFISFFLYFIIVRKSVRTVKKENDGINGNKEISFGSSKNKDLLI